MPPIGRRAILGGGLAAFMLAVLPDLSAPSLADAAVTPSRTPLARQKATKSKFMTHIKLADGPEVPYITPFQVQASCELSEDYFLSDQVILSAGDEVLPFTRPDGVVEAIVFSSGQLAHLHRDPSQVSGWSYLVISGVGSGVTGVAVNTDPTGRVTLMYYQRTSSTSIAATWLTVDSFANWSFYQTANPVVGPMNPTLSCGMTPEGSSYFYLNDSNGKFAVFAADPSGVWGAPTTITGLVGNDTAQATLLWDPSQSSQGVATGWALTVSSDNVLSVFSQTGFASFDPDGTTQGDVAALVWAGPPTIAGDLNPNAVYQDTGGVLYYTVAGQPYPLNATYGETLETNQTAVWLNGGLYSFAFLADGVVSVIAEYGDPQIPQFTDPIPLTAGFTQIYGLPSDPSEATLFAVDADSTLSVLTKSPTLGWSAVPILQDGATLQQLSTWRVQVSVLDANSSRVSGASVSVSADREIGVWQATGNTVIGPTTPVTLIADTRGHLTFAVPAVELDTAVLTVQALVGTTPSGPAFTVNPDIDAHQFLAGSLALTDQGSLSGASMTSAQNADGTSTFPLLASLSGGAQTSGANAMAAALNHMLGAGLGNVPGPSDPTSVSLDMSSGTPTFQTSTVTARQLRQLGSSDWWDAAAHDADSAYHGLRHGVIKMEQAASQWVKDEADDAFHWLVTLGVDIGDGLQHAMTIVITDMKSAIHVASSFLQALGTDLKDALDWLRHNVLELIRDASANATQLRGLIDELPNALGAELTKLGTLNDTFFSDQKVAVHAAIAAIATELEQFAFGASAPLPPPTNNTGSTPADKALADAATFLSHVSHNWLLDKIESWFAGDGNDAVYADVDAAIRDLITAFEDIADFATDIGTLFWNELKDLFGSQDSYNAATFGQLFSLFDQAIDDLLSCADAVANAFIDLAKAVLAVLEDILNTEVETIPLLGQILALANVDTSMAIGHLLTLVLMYPVTLFNQIKNGAAPLFPAPSSTARRLARQKGLTNGVFDWASGLNLSAGLIQGLWGAADGVGDLYRPDDQTAPGWVSWIDILSPIVIGVLQYPGKPNADGTTPAPFATPIDTASPQFGWTLLSWLLGFVPPIAALSGRSKALAGTDPTYATSTVPYITMLASVGSAVTGTVANFETGAAKLIKAGTVLGNVSNTIAPFATKELAESTEDVSVIIKLLVDGVGNVGAAYCLVEYASVVP